MDKFLSSSSKERRTLCEAAGAKLGLQAASIEKDFWVCWTLRELFTLPEIGSHLTFKGGTSLSKGWKLIERFSEDLDIVIERDFLGFGGEKAPENAPSQNQLEKRLECLKSACQEVVQKSLFSALKKRLQARIPKALDWGLVLDPDDVDRQTILFKYPAVFASGGYLRPDVKLELGARSDTEPSATPQIWPYLSQALPGEMEDSAFSLRTVLPERTFLEKTMLLHEETYRTGDSTFPARLARHYYDLWCLIRAGVAEKALANSGLFSRVAAHRALFFRKKREAQKTLRSGSLRILPLESRRPLWKKDYEAMRETMFFGETPSFEEILKVVGEFEKSFNNKF